MRREATFFTFLITAVVLAAAGCSSVKKRDDLPRLSDFEGKKVALVEVEGEPSARAVVEVALVNQLIQKGSFILIAKQEVEAARQAPEINPADSVAVARKVGADYALRAKILQFEAETKEGYSKETVEDSQLAAERGKDAGTTERYYKVKSLDGKVKIELAWTGISDLKTQQAIAEQEETVTAEAKNSSIHLPPRLRFLEKLTNEAFRKFFERYN